MRDSKIKILLIVEAMLGGIRQHVLDIIYGLDKGKFEVYLAYSDGRADDNFFSEVENLKKHAKLFRCEHMQRELSLSKDLKALKELKKLIKEINPDIVHCHSSKAGIVGRMAAGSYGVKNVYYTPNAYSFQNPHLGGIKRRIYVEAEKFLSRYMTTMTINVSKGEMEQALSCRIDKPEKFTLIYNGIRKEELPDKSEIRKQNGFDEEQILIGVTARLAEQKDPMTFLKIAKEVINRDNRTEFIYIGDGDMEQQMKAWLREQELENRIHMLGYRQDASTLVTMLDIYLSTALYEGLPYSMIEAMRAGVPIIATDVVGNNELVTEGNNGMLFPVKDVEEGVRLIMKQIQYNTIKGEFVRVAFVQKYSSEVMIKKLENLFGGGQN